VRDEGTRFLIDPYICQRCHRLFPYLDLMGGPQCECGSESFWPLPNEDEIEAQIAQHRAATVSGDPDAG
jgi:hypothetical protein